jgi:hypothetical protein
MSYVEKRPWLGFTLLPEDEELHNLEFYNGCREKARKPRWWNILITTEVETDTEVKSCELRIRPPTRMDLTQMSAVLTEEIDRKLHEEGLIGYTKIHVRAFILSK